MRARRASASVVVNAERSQRHSHIIVIITLMDWPCIGSRHLILLLKAGFVTPEFRSLRKGVIVRHNCVIARLKQSRKHKQRFSVMARSRSHSVILRSSSPTKQANSTIASRQPAMWVTRPSRTLLVATAMWVTRPSLRFGMSTPTVSSCASTAASKGPCRIQSFHYPTTRHPPILCSFG